MSEPIDPRVTDAIEHLQRAALELIAAARNALDVAESLTRDPAPLQALVEGALLVFQRGGADHVGESAEAGDNAEPAARRVQRLRVD